MLQSLSWLCKRPYRFDDTAQSQKRAWERSLARLWLRFCGSMVVTFIQVICRPHRLSCLPLTGHLCKSGWTGQLRMRQR